MSIEEAAARMPAIPALLDRCRALAALSSICPGHYSYVFTPSDDGGRLSIESDSRSLGVHHGADGTLVWAWDVDESDAEGVQVEQVPQPLLPHLVAMTRSHGPDGHVWWRLSSVMWRLPGDSAWTAARYPGVDALSSDMALFCLGDLLDPSPGNLWLPDNFGAEHGSFARADAIRHVLALRPLTEDIVRALNPERSLEEVAEAVRATGYHPTESPIPLDRGVGEGAPLVAVDTDDHTSTCRFFFEPDGEGYHRILVHHSGKAVQADTSDSGVVQREPDGGNAQKFLIEEYRDGHYHRVDQLVGLDRYRGPLDIYETEDLAASAFRIRAKQSGLVLQRPLREGDPVHLVDPQDDPAQMMHASMPYGYGVWGQLLVGVRPSMTPYR
ncbi:RICIN domain-containing protein [Streptomyces microflavus]|uniref:RICIN domain-containing protein n=1 Tax=Streptomyces microflavus TaxID=1919 RepID=UPI0037F606E5